MRPAQQDQVAHRCRSVVDPVLDVVAVGPLRRPRAVLRDAAPVPERECPPGGSWGRSAGPGELRVELAFADDPADGGVAGDAADRLGRDDGAAVQLPARRIGRAQQGLDAGPDDQVRPRPGAIGRAESARLAELDQAVGATLPGRAIVVPGRR